MSVLPLHIQHLIIEQWYSHSQCLLQSQYFLNRQKGNWVNQRRLEISLVSKCWFKKISMLVSSDTGISTFGHEAIESVSKLIESTSSPIQLRKSIGKLLVTERDNAPYITFKDIYGYDEVDMVGKEEQMARLYSSLSHLSLGSIESVDLVESYFKHLTIAKETAMDWFNDGNKHSLMYNPIKDLHLLNSKPEAVHIYNKLLDTLTPFIIERVETFLMITDIYSFPCPSLDQICFKLANSFHSLKKLNISCDMNHDIVIPKLLDSLPQLLESLAISNTFWHRPRFSVPFTKLLKLGNLQSISLSNHVIQNGFGKYIMDPLCRIQHIESKLKEWDQEFVDFIKQDTRLKTISIELFPKNEGVEDLNEREVAIKYNAIISSIQFNTTSQIQNLSIEFIDGCSEVMITNIMGQLSLLVNLTNLHINISRGLVNVVVRELTQYVDSPSCKLIKLETVMYNTSNQLSNQEIISYLESVMVKNKTLRVARLGSIVNDNEILDSLLGSDGMVHRLSTNMEYVDLKAYAILCPNINNLGKHEHLSRDKSTYYRYDLNLLIYKKNI